MVSKEIKEVVDHLYDLKKGTIEYDFGDIVEMSFENGKWVRITVEDCDPYVDPDEE